MSTSSRIRDRANVDNAYLDPLSGRCQHLTSSGPGETVMQLIGIPLALLVAVLVGACDSKYRQGSRQPIGRLTRRFWSPRPVQEHHATAQPRGDHPAAHRERPRFPGERQGRAAARPEPAIASARGSRCSCSTPTISSSSSNRPTPRCGPPPRALAQAEADERARPTLHKDGWSSDGHARQGSRSPRRKRADG